MKQTYRFKLRGDVFFARLYEKNTVTMTFDREDWQIAQKIAQDLNGREAIKLTVEDDVKKRSLDANAFAWVLIRELSDYYKVKPIDVYREQILDLNTYTVVPIKTDEVDKWISMWEDRGSGWLVVNLGDSKIKGYKNLKCFRGSSTFDSREMSRLIDNLVQECEQAGIIVDREKIEEARNEWKTGT